MEVAEKEGFEGAPVDPYLEEEDNDAFLNQCSSEESSSEEEHSSNEEEWDDDNEDDNGQVAQPSWIDSGATFKAKTSPLHLKQWPCQEVDG